MSGSAATVAPQGDPGQATPATDLFWRGRPLLPTHAAALFFGFSLSLLTLGIGLNYALTHGAWHTNQPSVSSPFGGGPEYLTSRPYDVATLFLLWASLITLGSGFAAAYRPRLASPWLLALAGAALLSFLGWIQTRSSNSEPNPLLALSAVLGTAGLVWAAGARLGAGVRMHQVRALGFVLFGFYWATQVMRLYTAEEGDFVNALFAALAVLFFNYAAYHELLSVGRNEDPRALHWLSGAAFLTTGLYVATHKLQVISEWLILRVAEQTTWLLQWFGQGVVRAGGVPDGSQIYYPTDPAAGIASDAYFPIQIILACTAIQSIMIFVGGILALRPPRFGDGVSGRPAQIEKLGPTYQTRRLIGFLLTVPLIYSLNLLRNVTIITLSAGAKPAYFADHAGATTFICRFSTEPACGPADAAFWFAHNIIGKGGSLVALIIIAFMVFQILPELYDSIVGLLDLKQRWGPLERFWGARQRRGGNGGAPARLPSKSSAPLSPAEPLEAR